MKVMKVIGIGLFLEVAAVAVFWAALAVSGTRWAALFGLAALPLLLVMFPEKKGRRR